MSERILISSNLPAKRREWSRHLEARGYDVIAFGSGATWLEDVLRSPVDLILLEDGKEVTRLLSLTSRMQEPRPWIFLLRSPRLDWSRDPVIGETAPDMTPLLDYSSLEIAGWAPDDLRAEVLVPWVEMALENRRLAQREAETRRTAFSRMARSLLVGNSAAVRRLRDELESRYADDRPLVLVGEPGSGRERAARWIHFEGARSGGRFVAFAFEGLSGPELGRRLFGYRRETRHKPGDIELAHGGSLFLPNAGRLPHSVQEDFSDFLRTGQLYEYRSRRLEEDPGTGGSGGSTNDVPGWESERSETPARFD